jgi:hypothetical protein
MDQADLVHWTKLKTPHFEERRVKVELPRLTEPNEYSNEDKQDKLAKDDSPRVSGKYLTVDRLSL